MYKVSFGLFQGLLQGFAGSDGTVDGVLLDNIVDTNNITYRYRSELGHPLTIDENNFANATWTTGSQSYFDCSFLKSFFNSHPAITR